MVGTGLQKTTGPSSEKAIILSGFRLYKPRSPSLTTQMRRKKKKVYKKTFGKVVWKFSEDRPRRAGSTSYFTNCSLPAHSSGLRDLPLPRNGRRPGAVPEPPRWSTAPQPRAGPNRPRSLPVDWRRFLREALGPRPKAGLWPLRKQKEPEKGPPARGLQQVEGRKLPNNLRPRRGPAPRVT